MNKPVLNFANFMKTIIFFMLLMINTGHAQYFQLAFDNGRVDSFDSNHDLFKREMCDADDQWVPLKLTGDEIQSLLPLIDDVDFFNLPEDQTQLKVLKSDKNITVSCFPCAKSQLQIVLGQKSKKVFWDCGCDARNSTPGSIKLLVEKLEAILYERKEVKSIKATDCAFI